DIQTGRLEWIVNGYQSLATSVAHGALETKSEESLWAALPPLTGFSSGEMKRSEDKIGAEPVDKWKNEGTMVSPLASDAPPKLKMEKGAPIPLPPPVRRASKLHQPWKKKPGT